MIAKDYITEDYVSFEIAKLLKEKGFDEPCWFWYNPIGEFRRHYSEPAKSSSCYEIACPTLQMTMKWLREKYKLEIYPFHEKLQGDSWWYRIERDITFVNITEYEEDLIFASYEQACEAAIKYCLENLI